MAKLVRKTGLNPVSLGVQSCQGCQQPLLAKTSKTVKFLNQQYHVDCFTCAICKVQLRDLVYALDADGNDDPGPVKTNQGSDSPKSPSPLKSSPIIKAKRSKNLCKKCYFSKAADRCYKCRKAILDQCVVLPTNQRKLHRDCFRCHRCQELLDLFYEDQNQNLLCRRDYMELTLPRCPACSQLIEPQEPDNRARCLVYQNNAYHPECFRCDVCGDDLDTARNDLSTEHDPVATLRVLRTQNRILHADFNKIFYPFGQEPANRRKLCKACALEAYQKQQATGTVTTGATTMGKANDGQTTAEPESEPPPPPPGNNE